MSMRNCGLALAAVLVLAFAFPADAAGKGKKKPAPVKKGKGAKDKKGKKDDKKGKDDKKTKDDKQKKAEDDAAKALALLDQARGPTFPGKDPAFLLLPRSSERNDMPERLLTEDVVKMTDRALQYLARTQDANGGWSDVKFPANVGVTALCCLAFMGEGSRPKVGRYGKNIYRGMEFVLNNVQSSGIIKGGNPYGPMYEHVFGLLALLFSYGDMPKESKTINDIIAKGIQEILKAQRLDGGWRYQFSREGHSDMSLTANVLWVLRTAKKSGFTVSKEAIKKGVKFVEECSNPDGTFRYRVFGLHAAPSLGGTGIIALCNDGKINHRLIPNARYRIDYDYKRYTVRDLKERRYTIYGTFYASLAMYMCGDKYWIPWYKKCQKVYTTMQRKDGEFWDEHDCTIYPTAMAAIVLQAPRGYLPIYER